MEKETDRDSDEYTAIPCPHCGHMHDFCDDAGAIITFWGEDDPTEKECHACEKTFFIRENVTRSWTSLREEDEDIL